MSRKNDKNPISSLLNTDDLALWRRVAETVEPLPSRDVVNITGRKDISKINHTVAPRQSKMIRQDEVLSNAAHQQTSSSQIAFERLDRRTRSRLARGSYNIDASLDLHGFSQNEAHSRLYSFLFGSQKKGYKFVLIITGKGGYSQRSLNDEQRSDWTTDRGILRRNVPQWLNSSKFRSIVLSVEEAHATHGGRGALYIRLRRLKK